MSADSYQFWRDALDGIISPIHDGDAFPGYYRLRKPESQGKRGAKKFIGASAVAIWEQDGNIVASVDGNYHNSPADLFLLVCKYPVSEEDYGYHRAHGIWPDVKALEEDA